MNFEFTIRLDFSSDEDRTAAVSVLSYPKFEFDCFGRSMRAEVTYTNEKRTIVSLPREWASEEFQAMKQSEKEKRIKEWERTIYILAVRVCCREVPSSSDDDLLEIEVVETVQRYAFYFAVAALITIPNLLKRIEYDHVLYRGTNWDIDDYSINRFLLPLPVPKERYDGITWEKTIKWLFQRVAEKQEYVSSFNLALRRDHYEILLYSIMGLERLYTKGKNGTTHQLKQRLPVVFNHITAKDIENIYNLRSKFAHGNISLIDEYITAEDWQLSQKALVLLLLSIRELVKNDATKINFQIEISHSYS